MGQDISKSSGSWGGDVQKFLSGNQQTFGNILSSMGGGGQNNNNAILSQMMGLMAQNQGNNQNTDTGTTSNNPLQWNFNSVGQVNSPFSGSFGNGQQTQGNWIQGGNPLSVMNRR